MKGCELCEIPDHQQKLNGRLDHLDEENNNTTITTSSTAATNSSNRGICNHGRSNYGSYLRDMFLAAHLLRGEYYMMCGLMMILGFSLFCIVE